VLLGLGGVFAFLVGPHFAIVMAGYFILTTAYSFSLKRKIILDICALAGLYTTRIIAGGVATGIPLSVWLLAFSIFIFLSLAAVKRQAELVDLVSRGKKHIAGRGYSADDLPVISMIAIAAGYISAVLTVLYVSSSDVIKLYANPQLLWGISVVLLYWISRAVMLAHRGQMHDDPVVFAVRDRTSQLCFLIILGLAVAGTVWPT
jgi:4-hydroxybenzoate polyprenyltransferase